jgi:hypothetical protein
MQRSSYSRARVIGHRMARPGGGLRHRHRHRHRHHGRLGPNASERANIRSWSGDGSKGEGIDQTVPPRPGTAPHRRPRARTVPGQESIWPREYASTLRSAGALPALRAPQYVTPAPEHNRIGPMPASTSAYVSMERPAGDAVVVMLFSTSPNGRAFTAPRAFNAISLTKGSLQPQTALRLIRRYSLRAVTLHVVISRQKFM